ncbi:MULTISPECIES: DUF2975 domain-containing protein [Micrococcaceae]|uniref:DUF2975 domain-containing protein n=1 Tax=Micrococcaceae TaxID=1268 RepID=UPI001FD813DF|nr:DUF2975 domain-containing protein [Arthrobacter sp. PvP023]
MIASAAGAVVTTVLSVAGIIGYFTGPVTLELPVAARDQAVSGLELESTGRYTSLEATVPQLPVGPAELLAWGSALTQIGVLAILALVFVLAHRLRSATLFTAKSVGVVGACGAVIAVAGTLGQILDGWALNRVAEMIAANGRTPGASYVFSAEINLAPLTLGLVMVLVAGVFQYGRRLQLETEGLV